MIDFVESTAEESRRFQAAIEAIIANGSTSALSAVRVPSCPDWTVADLTWHLAEVQYFWATIVEGNLATPSAVPDLERPADSELLTLAVGQTNRLVRQLAERGSAEPCWSWHDAGHNVGWVRRRQAHEALIHRVDAELALESETEAKASPIDTDLAADGIDEMLRVMLDATNRPDWAQFEPDGSIVGIEVIESSPVRPDGPTGPTKWAARLGRFTGTDPSGRSHDVAALELLSPDNQSFRGAASTAVLSGPAAEIDLWLWGRASLVDSTVEGDRSIIERVREMAAVQ